MNNFEEKLRSLVPIDILSIHSSDKAQSDKFEIVNGRVLYGNVHTYPEIAFRMFQMNNPLSFGAHILKRDISEGNYFWKVKKILK